MCTCTPTAKEKWYEEALSHSVQGFECHLLPGAADTRKAGSGGWPEACRALSRTTQPLVTAGLIEWIPAKKSFVCTEAGKTVVREQGFKLSALQGRILALLEQEPMTGRDLQARLRLEAADYDREVAPLFVLSLIVTGIDHAFHVTTKGGRTLAASKKKTKASGRRKRQTRR